jgi:uncharacterized protein (TIGR02145 family)
MVLITIVEFISLFAWIIFLNKLIMQKKHNILICLLLMAGIFSLFTFSCKKDDTNKTADIIMKDVDGNVYHTVTIGTQVWTIENLRTTRYNDSTAIPVLTYGKSPADLTAPFVCTYNNTANTDTINTYGRLYNWYAIDNNKVCPKGWHIPSNYEWTTLVDYLIAHGYSYDGLTAGSTSAGGTTDNKIAKAIASSTGWVSSQIEGSVGNTDYPAKMNATGFTALPGGSFNANGQYVMMGSGGFWWSSTENSANTTVAFGRSLINSYYSINQGIASKTCGLSIRCVKD